MPLLFVNPHSIFIICMIDIHLYAWSTRLVASDERRSPASQVPRFPSSHMCALSPHWPNFRFGFGAADSISFFGRSIHQTAFTVWSLRHDWLPIPTLGPSIPRHIPRVPSFLVIRPSHRSSPRSTDADHRTAPRLVPLMQAQACIYTSI